MGFNRKAAIWAGSTIAVLATLPVLAQRAPTSGPIARYDMRAGTVYGFAAQGGGMGGAMSMAFGGGGDKVQKELYLRLGSSSSPVGGTAKAIHFMPPGAKLGKSVALATPKEERAVLDTMPQRPTGKLYVFWGCGERAPKGQPVIIDFAKVAEGQMPPGMWSSTVLRDLGPNLTNSKVFGRWPAEDNKFVKSDSSLLGAHRVAGNYSPEMAFTLTQDFMAPLRTTASVNPSGSTLLSWASVPGTTGYLAFLFGGKMNQGGQISDMVMWTSSGSRQFGGGLTDWLSPGQVAGLVKDRTVMPPSATSCTVPAEVRTIAPDFRIGMMTAFGPEEDFAYPPRPADAKAVWNLQWTARIRHRSSTSWMDMPGMAGMEGQPGQPEQKKKCKGGILGRAAGIC